MSLDRRGLFSRLALAASGLAGVAVAARDAGAQTQGPLKVVYHLADFDKVGFVLGNIENHIEGAGGPGKVTIALVVHGPALRGFHSAGASPDIRRRTGWQRDKGVALHACGNTMKGQNVTLAQLLPGFEAAPQGGVTKIAELQAQGYFYIRP